MENSCPYCFMPVGAFEKVCPACGKAIDIEVPYHHLRPGTVLRNRYTIGASLGQGGFGITYTGYDSLLRRKVAIKEYYPNGLVNRSRSGSLTVTGSAEPGDIAFFEKGKQRFHNEACILARFAGEDGIVNVLDYFPENNTVYIVMEFLEGISLKEFLHRSGKLSTKETFDLFMPVMNVLKQIHREELIHRDISPDNIMLIRKGGRLQVKLIDFGAARNISAHSPKSLTVMLKPGFAPIEQYGSNDEQGAWTDIYALCATIYKCITGVTPPPAPNRVNSDKLQKPSELGADIDVHAETVLLKGMCVSPEDRYQTIDALLRALREPSEKLQPITDPPITVQQETFRPVIVPLVATQGKTPQPEMDLRGMTPEETPQPDPDSYPTLQWKIPQPESYPQNRVQKDKPQSRADGSRKQSDGRSSKRRAVLAVSAGCVVLLAVCLLVIPRLLPGGDEDVSVDPSGTADASVTQATTEAETAVDPDDPAAAFVSDAFIDPINGWSAYDDLIDQINSEPDTAKRVELMHQAEDILMSNYCVIPLYFINDVYMQKDYVKGVYVNPFTTKLFMYASMSNGSDTLRLNLSGDGDSFDPALVVTQDGISLASHYFVGLYSYNAEGKTTPACADGYTVSADGLTYTVTLKSGLKWSDGTALTAADFEYAWKRAADPATGAGYQYLFSGFAGFDDGAIRVTAVDDTTLQFVLSGPCVYMEELMAFPTFYPVKQEVVENAANWKTKPDAWCQEPGFVCNGAYVCTDRIRSESITFEKNPNFYNAGQVTINKLEYMIYDNPNDVYRAYAAGDLDFANSIPTDVINSLTENNDPELHIADKLGTYCISFNANSELFEGKTPAQAACMREAFSLLIDRDSLCKNTQTSETPASSFIPPGMADGNGGVFRTDVDAGYYNASAISNDPEGTIAKARKLLEAAGYVFDDDGKLSADTPIEIKHLVLESGGYIASAECLRSNLEVVGISMTLCKENWSDFQEARRNGSCDMSTDGWIADFNNPINTLEMWTTSSGNNHCHFGSSAGRDS